MSSVSSSDKKDPAWDHFYLQNPNDKKALTCNYCNKVSKRDVYRAKQHLVGGCRNVTGCKKVPDAVKAEIKQYMVMKQQMKEQLNLMPDMDTLLEEELEDEDEEMVQAQIG